MNKDELQKDLLCRHFGSLGYFVQPETKVIYREGVQGSDKEITDVDVLALVPGSNLNWELILGDCKTLKEQSPANRVLWLRGLMSYMGASSGIIILKKEKVIDLDHKLLASSMGITLIEEQTFNSYDKAIIYPSGSSKYPLSIKSLTRLRQTIPNRFPAFRSLINYLYMKAWNEQNRIELLRRVIGEVREVSKEIDPANIDHLALVLEAISVFSVGLAECVGKIFNQHLQPEKQDNLDNALKSMIWGGRSNYEFVSKLRSELMEAKGFPPEELTLPKWDGFLQLIRNILEQPKLGFFIPQLLRKASTDLQEGSPFLSDFEHKDLLLIKFGMLTLNYFVRASNLPAQVRSVLEEKFTRRQFDLADSNFSKISTENNRKKANISDSNDFEETDEQGKLF